MPPSLWVVVENGSRDSTLEIAQSLAAQTGWITVLPISGEGAPVRGAPDRAVDRGCAGAILDEEQDVVVNVDADVSVAPDFFAMLIDRFAVDAELGIASGTCLRAASRARGANVTSPGEHSRLGSDASLPP